MKNKLFLAFLLLLSFNIYNARADALQCECGTDETVINDDGSILMRSYGTNWDGSPWSYQTLCSPNSDGTANCTYSTHYGYNETYTCESMEACTGLSGQEEVALAEILGFTPPTTWQGGYKSQEVSSNTEQTGSSENGNTQVANSSETGRIGKRIYTVEEAMRLVKPTGNVVKLRFK